MLNIINTILSTITALSTLALAIIGCIALKKIENITIQASPANITTGVPDVDVNAKNKNHVKNR